MSYDCPLPPRTLLTAEPASHFSFPPLEVVEQLFAWCPARCFNGGDTVVGPDSSPGAEDGGRCGRKENGCSSLAEKRQRCKQEPSRAFVGKKPTLSDVFLQFLM